jgi:ABC-2 type transport system permease protein
MTSPRHTNRLWLAANAFGATLRRDLAVTRRELPQFLVQALIQPMFFLLIFCKILPSIGLTSGNFAALLLPGIVGLTELMAAIQGITLPLVLDLVFAREIDDRLSYRQSCRWCTAGRRKRFRHLVASHSGPRVHGTRLLSD